MRSVPLVIASYFSWPRPHPERCLSRWCHLGASGGHDRAVSASEPVEVIDGSGAVVGIVSRAVMRRDNLRHRAVYVAVCDSAGRLLVHQRSATKDLWPSRWDIAVGGVMAPGESWVDSARRELAEEVGIGG